MLSRRRHETFRAKLLTVHQRRGLAWTERQVATGTLSVGQARLDIDAIFAEVEATAVAE